MALTSCGQKRCFCYERTGAQVYESEIYINPDTPCSSMTRGERGCVEKNERMDPGQVAKKQDALE